VQSAPPAGAASPPHLPHLLLPPATTTTTVGAGSGLAVSLAMMGARQEGQLARVRSQASTHAPWNPCPHPGSTRTLSPSANSVRHIAHSDVEHHGTTAGEGAVAGDVADSGGDTEKETVGSASMAFFLSPLGGGDVWSELDVRRRRHAQRETRAKPRTHMSAQSTDARISTMSESTTIPSGAVCCPSGVARGASEEDVSPGATAAAVRCRRRLAGARMVVVCWCGFELCNCDSVAT
jgi:hypothetical protein